MLVVLAPLVAFAPSAAATLGTFTIEDASSADVLGDLGVTLPGGSGRVLSHDATGVIEVTAFTGSVTVWTWTEQNTHVADIPILGPQRSMTDERFELLFANLTAVARAERSASRVQMTEGSITVRGPVDDVGLPVWLQAPVSQSGPGTVLDPYMEGAEEIDWQWDAGWPFIGAYNTTTQLRGYPSFGSAIATLEGAGRLQLSGGNLTFADANGTLHKYRLGNWTEAPGDLGASDTKTRVQTVRHAILEGEFGSSVIPLPEQWGFAGPTMAWTHEGSARWHGASGAIEADGMERSFRDAEVRAEGAMNIAIEPNGVVRPISRASYEAEGDFVVLSVDGRAVGPPPSERGRAAATLTFLGILVGVAAWFTQGVGSLAARLAVPFYTRISRAGALEHPARKRLCEIVEANPGIYLRALHRELGGSWGPFMFHVRLLARLGFVTLRKEAQFQALYPAGAAVLAPAARGTQARVLEAARRAAGPPDVAALSSELELSPRLVRYHLASLRKRGLLSKHE